MHTMTFAPSVILFLCVGLRKLVGAFSFPWDKAKACDAEGDSHTDAVAQKCSAVQCGVMGFSDLYFLC